MCSQLNNYNVFVNVCCVILFRSLTKSGSTAILNQAHKIKPTRKSKITLRGVRFGLIFLKNSNVQVSFICNVDLPIEIIVTFN